jgi:hypothetical protein
MSSHRRNRRAAPLPHYLERRQELLKDPDAPIYGAEDFAIVLKFFDDEGEPDERAAYYAAEAGHVDAGKMGRQWVSTPNRLLKPHLMAKAG